MDLIKLYITLHKKHFWSASKVLTMHNLCESNETRTYATHRTCFFILQLKQIYGHCLPQTRPEYRSEVCLQEMSAFLNQFTKHYSNFLLLAHSLCCPHMQRSEALQHARRAAVIRSCGKPAESELQNVAKNIQWLQQWKITGYPSEGAAQSCCNTTQTFFASVVLEYKCVPQ